MIPPDYENYDYLNEWKNRDILDNAERVLIRKLAGKPKITLEMGGGFGRITSILESLSEETYMVDYSSRNIAEASKRLSKTKITRCNFFNLPFDDGMFDLIVMVRVMHHIEDPQRLYREVERVAMNGARFVVSVPNSPFNQDEKGEGISEVKIEEGKHRIFTGPLSSYAYSGFKLEKIYGTGLFDNRLGRGLHMLTWLYLLDIATARLWKLKNNLFLVFTITKSIQNTSNRTGKEFLS